ncbi:MAG TPA: hypothetical protein VM734_19765 [Kofleriaceae bacterium]|nr:hypothetical protein [Kofleriaceae bacterium]
MVWIVLGTIGIVLAMVGLGVLIDRKWALLPRADELRRIEPPRPPAPPPPPPGETPATAVRADARARRRLLAQQRCCGVAMAEVGDEPLIFDRRRIAVVRLRCATCRATRSLYIEPI